MTRYESNCVSCGFPCRHEGCPYYKVLTLFCDQCGDEVEDLYDYDGKQVCEDCLLKLAHIKHFE